MTEVKIQTHDKKFHCDDVTAISLLTNYFGQKGIRVSVLRSREHFDDADILVDVGGEYNPEEGKFDHHQKSCNLSWNEQVRTPLSSAGMVWKHYGPDIVRLYLNSHTYLYLSDVDIEPHVDSIVNQLYFKIFMEIDANDNGIKSIEGGSRNYWTNLTLPGIVSSCNGDVDNSEEQNENFNKAVHIVSQILEIKFYDVIRNYFNYYNHYEYVKSSYESIPEDQEWILINKNLKSLYKCLYEIDPEYRIKFIIVHTEGEYAIKTRNRKGELFKNIADLLSENIMKTKLTHPDELIFIHKSLFIAKTTTLETAIEVVKFSLEEYNKIINKLKRINPRIPSLKESLLLGTVGLAGYFYYKNSE